MPPISVLGVHGLGDHRTSPWIQEWTSTLQTSWAEPNSVSIVFEGMPYDSIFEGTDISFSESILALGKLLGSGIGSLFRQPGTRDLAPASRASRGFLESASHYLRWYAGYVVAWVEDKNFQRATRELFYDSLRRHKPQVVLAHSLGSLITYNALTHPDAQKDDVRKLIENLSYISLGAQIGNGFVVGNLTHGRITMPPVKRWYHLFNEEDDVFTASISLPGVAAFQQIDTFFDIDGFADHSATEYLKHESVKQQVWKPLSLEYGQPATRSVLGRSLTQTKNLVRREPRRRALLVGINDYPNPADRLQGCVNDVYRMSATLQENGFTADHIRIVLNDRATARGILERMHWLLEEAASGDTLVFYYSGHGAQLPSYGEGDVVDHMDETLVPYDFNWSTETCISDDHIYSLYSQLPYDTRLTMIFDCCHSGGIHRNGGPRARGLTPPDDIRHRALRWNAETQMWVPRDLKPISAERSVDKDEQVLFCGSEGNVRKLGRSSVLRTSSHEEFQAVKAQAKKSKEKGYGPYLPLILEACQESQLAYEYRHGAESYGAFTYSLTDIIRHDKGASIKAMQTMVDKRLAELGYDQNPQILGPDKVVEAPLSWKSESPPAKQARKGKRKANKS